ncbi:protein disulfide isomerase CRELD2-like [Lytechinus pictus]|uniref:protein disulfide isomerase CRELD2-like n=1 Tax=Lytechinus pictus TaxID=7653 RepID=UPI0030B9D65B
MEFLVRTLFCLMFFFSQAVSPSFSDQRTEIICMDEQGILECVGGTIAIDSAVFGRTDTTSCPVNPPPTSLTGCEVDVVSGVNARCAAVDLCTLPGTSTGAEYLLEEPPCPDVRSKYLNISYHCKDSNECDLQLHNCDEHATCTNTPGSFICSCKTGYTGNGRECRGMF